MIEDVAVEKLISDEISTKGLLKSQHINYEFCTPLSLTKHLPFDK